MTPNTGCPCVRRGVPDDMDIMDKKPHLKARFLGLKPLARTYPVGGSPLGGYPPGRSPTEWGRPGTWSGPLLRRGVPHGYPMGYPMQWTRPIPAGGTHCVPWPRPYGRVLDLPYWPPCRTVPSTLVSRHRMVLHSDRVVQTPSPRPLLSNHVTGVVVATTCQNSWMSGVSS